MLKKINRISKKKEFEETMKRGRMYQSPLFGFLVREEKEEKRFGMIVSKKISKRAVDRNRIRRLLAEAVRINLKSFPEGVRGIFLGKKNLLGLKLEKVEEEVKKLIQKIENSN